MKPVTLPYLQSYKDRHGHQRHYFRRGSVRKALPGALGSPEFLEAYQLAKSAPTTPASQNKAVAGTIEALVQEFYASGEFTRGLAASLLGDLGPAIAVVTGCAHPGPAIILTPDVDVAPKRVVIAAIPSISFLARTART